MRRNNNNSNNNNNSSSNNNQVIYRKKEPLVPEHITERFHAIKDMKQYREELKERNLDAQMNYDDISYGKRISTLNKVQKMINRLKICEENTRQSILKDLPTYNLKPYLEETANAITQCPVTKTDIKFFMELVTVVNEDYEDFAKHLGISFVKSISNGGGLQEPEKQIIRRKNLLRLLGESLLIEIPIEPIKICEGLQAALVNQNYDALFTEQHIISAIEFGQNFSKQYIGTDSQVLEQHCVKYKLDLPEEECVLPPGEVKKIRLWIEQIYIPKLEAVLEKKYEPLEVQETRIQTIRGFQGNPGEEDMSLHADLLNKYESFRIQIQQMVNECGLLSKQSAYEFKDVTKIVANRIQMEKEMKKKQQEASYQESLEHKDYTFQDENTQALYEDLFDLKRCVPEILLQPQTQEQEEEALLEAEQEENKEDDQNQGEEEEQKQTFIMSTYKQCLEKLSKCKDKKVSDNLAEEFCYINSVKNRRRLINDILTDYDEKTFRDFMPYKVRVLVTLSNFWPQIIIQSEKILQERFLQYRDDEEYNFKAHVNFLLMCEFTKFGVFEPKVVLNSTKMLADTLNGPKLDYIIDMIGSCGKYFILVKESKMRFQMIMSLLQNKQEDKTIFDKTRKMKMKFVLGAMRQTKPEEKK